MKKNQTEIGNLKLQVDNLKNNLYQTNEVIGNMQSHLAKVNNFYHGNYSFSFCNHYYFRHICPALLKNSNDKSYKNIFNDFVEQ